MRRRDSSGAVTHAGLIFVVASALGGCGGSEDPAAPGAELLTDSQLTGSVGDGPIAGASMRVVSSDGLTLAEFQSDATAGYDVTVRTKGKYYPLTIEARGGTDLVTNLAPDFALFGAVTEPSKRSVANVNPFSTIAVELARELPGGLSKETLDTAEQFVVTALNSGLSTLAQTGTMGTEIGSHNVAEIVKAAETLGELIRRVRDARQTFSPAFSGDMVVKALASDLVDSALDGRGGPLVDRRAAALTRVVGAQVLLESMQNELRVNGQDATAAMTAAIRSVGGGGGGPTLDDLVVTPEMLAGALRGLDSALAVAATPQLEALRDALGQVEPGMSPAMVDSLVPDDYAGTLDAAIMTVASGSDAIVNAVNDPPILDGGGTNATNTAPTISGTPPTAVAVGGSYAFTPRGFDADGDPLTYGIVGQPAWSDFDPFTGALSGRPTDTDAGAYEGIVISVTDGEFVARLLPFAITVSAAEIVNSPPTISGTPPSEVTVNTAYSFQPFAFDVDGDLLTWTIRNLPAWASFDPLTGELSGRPTEAHVGTYRDIMITVSDGTHAGVSLAPFTVTVNAVSLGSATLSWTPPTENEDGSLLTDLAGYRIYWGTTPGVYPNVIALGNPGLTSYVVENLVPGTYEFVATAIDSTGLESARSLPATKIVR